MLAQYDKTLVGLTHGVRDSLPCALRLGCSHHALAPADHILDPEGLCIGIKQLGYLMDHTRI